MSKDRITLLPNKIRESSAKVRRGTSYLNIKIKYTEYIMFHGMSDMAEVNKAKHAQ